MRKIIIAAIGSAALGLFAASSASAAPVAAGSGAMIGSSALSAPVENVAWRNVCKNRTVWRTNRWGQPVRVKVRDCDRVWVGKPRPYNNGRYYSDRPYRPAPGFYGNGYNAPRPY